MQNKSLFAFTRINFILLGIALLIIVVGFVLMSGPGSTDTHFEPSIFDQRRTVVAPLICFVGYLFVIVSILYRPKRREDADHLATEKSESDEMKTAKPSFE